MNRARANSYKTAIGRKKPSAPSRWLVEHGKIYGLTLDYGCGRGLDAKHYGWGAFDPHYNQSFLYTGGYDTIVCNYVLNTLLKRDEKQFLSDIKTLLHDKLSAAYITVRRNVKKTGYTSKGTYQRNVKLNLPIVHENSDYCIYELMKS